jgi:PAS domain S-box-containing protein
MLWAGVRFGPRGAATASLAASLAAIIADSLDVGPFPERGELQAFIAISSVTTLVLSALAQERVRALLRKSAIQRGALDAIITIDTNGRVLELNPAAEELFKMSEADAVGRDLATLVIPPRLRDAYYRGLHRYTASGTSSIVGARYNTTAWRASDGQEFPVEIAVTRAPVDDQHVLTGFVRDISAQHAAEVARREASAELERKVAERTAELRESLRQGDMLLREIHHRVKNNLQVISSMLNLQAATAQDENARLSLLESQNRITAMALVHQLLYRSKEIGLIDFGDYLHRLIERLAAAYTVDASRIEIAVDAPAICVDLDRAIPCGLIVNELVTNALLHAFPGERRGHIRIGLARDHDLVALSVADDGIGLPPSIDLDAPHTFGLKILHALAKQIEGTTSRLGGPGTTIRVVFPAEARS